MRVAQARQQHSSPLRSHLFAQLASNSRLDQRGSLQSLGKAKMHIVPRPQITCERPPVFLAVRRLERPGSRSCASSWRTRTCVQLAEQAAQLAEKKDAQLAAALADAAGKGCADRGAGTAPMTTLPTKRRRRTTPWAPPSCGRSCAPSRCWPRRGPWGRCSRARMRRRPSARRRGGGDGEAGGGVARREGRARVARVQARAKAAKERRRRRRAPRSSAR